MQTVYKIRSKGRKAQYAPRCPIRYRVELNKSCQWYDQIMASKKNPFPLEFWDEYPIAARYDALQVIECDPNVYLFLNPCDFSIYVVDLNTGVELLIYDGKELTKDILENLEQENLLFEKFGYKKFNSDELKDKDGKSYQVIYNTYFVLENEFEDAVK